MEKTFEDKIKVNRLDLVGELCSISVYIQEYAEKSAVKRLELDRLKHKYETEKSKLYLDVKRNPEKYDFKKPTEAMVDSVISTNDELNALRDAVAEAGYELRILESAVKAFDTKREALSSLVKLHGQGYFSEPELEPADAEVVRGEQKKIRTERIRRKRERK